MKKGKFRAATVIFIIFNIINLFSFELNELKYSVANNFNDTIFSKSNVELNFIDNIPVYYSLKTSKHEINDKTDLYISFDNQNYVDETGNYSIIYKKHLNSKNKAIFGNSAYFISQDHRVELIGNKNSFFQSGENLGSFTISFWLYSSTYGSNETILKIGSEYFDKSKSKVIAQSINAKINNGKLFWEFINVFSTKNTLKEKILLESYSKIIPEKWTNVVLTYDSITGIIREYINNREEAVVVASVDGSLRTDVYTLKYNSINRCVITVAPTFYGAIDELKIIKNSEKGEMKKYFSPNGEIISKVIDFGTGGINIREIMHEDYKSNNSAIIYYFRHSDKPFSEIEEYSPDIKWKKGTSENITSGYIRFLQWKVVLLSGDEINHSPRLNGFTVKYYTNTPPSKPRELKAISSDNNVSLKWAQNSEQDVKGYKIYYGTKPGYYFGDDALEGKSPIDVGLKNTFTLTGLNENLIYYFTVTVYDDDEHSHESNFSDEVSIRPLKTN